MLEIPKKKRIYKNWGLALSAVAGVFVFYLAMNKLITLFEQKDVPEVLLVKATKGDVIAKVKAFGRLSTRDASTHIAMVDGSIAHIHVHPGSLLQQGDPIITLVNPKLERTYELARLDVLQAKAKEEGINAKLLQEEMELSNQVSLTASFITFAEKEFATMTVLVEDNIVSRLDYLKAENKLEKAKQEAELAKRKLEAFYISKASQQRAAKYEVEAAQTHLKLAQIDLENLVIRAESAGLLNEFAETYQRGAAVTQGNALFEISDPSKVYASLFIAASDAEYVAEGQVVELSLRQVPLKGKVTRIFPKVENNQIIIEVDLIDTIRADNIDNIEIAGNIVVAEAYDTLVLPTPMTLSKRTKELTLYVREGDAFYRRVVGIGVTGNESVEVLNGVSLGQQVAFNVPAELNKEAKIMKEALSNG